LIKTIPILGEIVLPGQAQPVRMGEMMNDSSLAKLVVTFVVLIGLAFWLKAERNKLLGCHINCPTDFSASSRGER
jgi:hypothetical protein